MASLTLLEEALTSLPPFLVAPNAAYSCLLPPLLHFAFTKKRKTLLTFFNFLHYKLLIRTSNFNPFLTSKLTIFGSLSSHFSTFTIV